MNACVYAEKKANTRLSEESLSITFADESTRMVSVVECALKNVLFVTMNERNHNELCVTCHSLLIVAKAFDGNVLVSSLMGFLPGYPHVGVHRRGRDREGLVTMTAIKGDIHGRFKADWARVNESSQYASYPDNGLRGTLIFLLQHGENVEARAPGQQVCKANA